MALQGGFFWGGRSSVTIAYHYMLNTEQSRNSLNVRGKTITRLQYKDSLRITIIVVMSTCVLIVVSHIRTLCHVRMHNCTAFFI